MMCFRPSLLTLLFSATLLASAEDKPSPGSLAQKKVEEWVLTRQLISKESSEWETEKQTLSGLNEIRTKETAQLDEFIQAAEERVEEIDKKRSEFSDTEQELKTWRRDIETNVAQFEERLRAEIPRFPPPLRVQVEEALLRLESPDPERPLQNRVRDVLVVLQSYVNFENTITVDAELREVDGTDREVDTLYLGLSQAWYVDRSGKFAGTGVPTSEGWKWTPDKSIASKVRRAIEIQTKTAQPGFVELPFTNVSTEN